MVSLSNIPKSFLPQKKKTMVILSNSFKNNPSSRNSAADSADYLRLCQSILTA